MNDSNRRYTLFMGVAILISLSELGAILELPGLLITFAILWLVFSLFYFLSSISIIAQSVSRDFQEKTYASITLLLGLGVLLVIDAFTGKSLSLESPQQVTCALRALSQQDYGLFSPCFLGYPARQYVLPSLPTLLFGPSLFSLKIGYAFVFYFGALLFWTALRTFLGDLAPQKADLVSTISMSLMFGIPLVVKHVGTYEQTIIPLGLTMQALAWFVMCYRQPTNTKLLALLWSAGLLAHSYTPSLGTLGLLVCACFYVSLNLYKSNDKQRAWAYCCLFLGILVLTGSSLAYRQDLGSHLAFPPNLDPLINTISIFSELFSQPSFFFGVLNFFPAIIYILCATTGQFGLTHFFIGLWILGITFCSMSLNGYWLPNVEHGAHRALIILPVMIFAMAHLLKKYVDLVSIKTLVSILIIVLAFNANVISLSRPLPLPQLPALVTASEASQKLKLGQTKGMQVGWFSPRLNHFHYGSEYFFKNATRLDHDSFCDGQYDQAKDLLVIAAPDEKCLPEFEKQSGQIIKEPKSITITGEVINYFQVIKVAQ